MSAETDWTVETLRVHFETQLRDLKDQLAERHASQQKQVTDALASAEKAVGKADAATEKRFDAVNEFRAQLADQAAKFLTLQEYKTAHAALAEKVATASEARAREIAEMDRRHTFDFQGLASRLDVLAGASEGASAQKTERRLDTGSLVGLAVLVVMIVTAAVTVLIATR